MSGSGKYKDNLNFCAYYGAAEENQAKVLELLRKINKKLGAAEKNKEKYKAICTGFSVLVSQSVVFQGKQKFKC